MPSSAESPKPKIRIRKHIHSFRPNLTLISIPSGFRKRNDQLDEALRQVEKQCQQIASAVRCLVDLTEAIRMDLATRYQRGPLAGLRQRVLSDREQFQMKMNPKTDHVSRHETEDPPSLASIDPAAVEEGSPWTRKNLLTLGTYYKHPDDKTDMD